MIWMFTAGHKAPARFVTAHIMWVNFVEMQPPGALRFIPLDRPLWTPLEWNPSLFFCRPFRHKVDFSDGEHV